MKSVDLLDAIGDAKETYLLDAANAWESAQPMKKGPSITRKILFIAAVVALLTCLLGCAIVMLRMRDQQIGERSYTRYYNEDGQRIEPTEVTQSIVSIRGYKDSPNYLATMEWYEFKENYPSILEFDFQDQSLENYEIYEYIYGCYSQEMVDKVDEISEKYDLKLLSQEVTVQRWQEQVFFDAYGIDGLCNEDKAARINDGSGYFYPEGNFKYDFTFLLPQENGNWGYEVAATICYSRDGYFHPSYGGVDMEMIEEWNYTTSDGVEVLIAQNYRGADIIAQKEGAFLWVSLDAKFANDETTMPTKHDIELMAEVIDFSVELPLPDMTGVEEKLAEAEKTYEEQMAQEAQQKAVTYASYGEFIKEKYIDGAESRIGTPYMRNYYALMDLNGDGVEELMLGEKDDCFKDLYTIENGELEAIRKWIRMNLCQNNIILITQYNMVDEICCYWFCKVDGNELTTLDHVDYWDEMAPNLDTTSWYRILGYTESRTEYEIISEEEVKKLLDKYPVIDLEMKPINEFPME